MLGVGVGCVFVCVCVLGACVSVYRTGVRQVSGTHTMISLFAQKN